MAAWKRQRRKQIHSDDGWTVVAGGRADKNDEANKLQSSRPVGTAAGLTLDKLLCELDAMERKWKNSSCAKTLDRMLSLREWKVQQAVCIGIGSFSIDWDHRYRSLWQLVLFRAVIQSLHGHGPPLALYAQEPAFTPLDTTFLARLGINTIATSIETHIVPNSFVFAPFVDWYILLPLFLKAKDPELYIGNEILDSYGAYANTTAKKEVLGECNLLGKRFSERRERRRVPGFEEHGNALEGLMVYWKEEEEDEEEEKE